jgi:hypothetical protein
MEGVQLSSCRQPLSYHVGCSCCAMGVTSSASFMFAICTCYVMCAVQAYIMLSD